jgi:hypothetical protein
MKLTGWYSGDQKPDKENLYQRRLKRRIGYSYFENGYWSTTSANPVRAEFFRAQRSAYQDLPWRGIEK